MPSPIIRPRPDGIGVVSAKLSCTEKDGNITEYADLLVHELVRVLGVKACGVPKLGH
jgi:hypothetical protein